MLIESLPLIIAVVFGAINCFYGYRLFQWLLTVWGFVLGISMAGELAAQLSDGNMIAIVIAGIIGGIIGASVFAALYFLGVFIIGAAFLVSATDAVTEALAIQMHPLFLLIPGIIGGLLALVLQKLIIVLATGFLGAFWLVAAGAAWKFGHGLDAVIRDPRVLGENLVPALGLAFVLGLLGVLVQFLITAKGFVAKSKES
jgi:hypothetical protein